MPTVTQAYNAARSRIEGGGLLFPLRWQNEDLDSEGNRDLPNKPKTFAYIEFLTGSGRFEAFGAGRGNNTQRTPALVLATVLVPRGKGLQASLDAGETIAVLFRGYRDTIISCFAATVHPGGDGASAKPPGLDSAVDAYFWSQVEVELFFDQLG